MEKKNKKYAKKDERGTVFIFIKDRKKSGEPASGKHLAGYGDAKPEKDEDHARTGGAKPEGTKGREAGPEPPRRRGARANRNYTL